VDRATGSGRKIDTAQILRGNSVMRLMTMFGTFMNTQYNAWRRETGLAVQDKDLTRFLAFVGIRYLMFVGVSALVTGAGGDPEKDRDKYYAKWAMEFAKFPAKLFPVFGDVGALAVESMLGIKGFGYKMSPIESHIANLEKTFAAGRGAIEGKKTPAQFMEQLTSAASFVAPYPDMFNDLFWNAWDIYSGNMSFNYSDLMKRRPLKERR
jgi:hypothetical protein